MGTFTYDSSLRAEIEDRLLTHLELVITAKLRRAECFTFSWPKRIEDGGGRTTVWMTPYIPLSFDYLSTEMPPVSREWIENLSKSANGPRGLHISLDPSGVTPETSPSSQEMLD